MRKLAGPPVIEKTTEHTSAFVTRDCVAGSNSVSIESSMSSAYTERECDDLKLSGRDEGRTLKGSGI